MVIQALRLGPYVEPHLRRKRDREILPDPMDRLGRSVERHNREGGRMFMIQSAIQDVYATEAGRVRYPIWKYVIDVVLRILAVGLPPLGVYGLYRDITDPSKSTGSKVVFAIWLFLMVPLFTVGLCISIQRLRRNAYPQLTAEIQDLVFGPKPASRGWRDVVLPTKENMQRERVVEPCWLRIVWRDCGLESEGEELEEGVLK